MASAEQYFDRALGQADYRKAREVAMNKTSKAQRRDYVSQAANAGRGVVIFVTDTRESSAVAGWRRICAPTAAIPTPFGG